MKSLFLGLCSIFVLMSASTCAPASQVYCPATITCTASGGNAYCSQDLLGSGWSLMNSEPLPSTYVGTFPLSDVGGGDTGLAWCNFKTTAAGKIEYIYFKNAKALYPDVKAPDTGWIVPPGHGCRAATPQGCPFTDVKP